MIIFGWGGGKPKQLGEVAPITCPNCQRDIFFQHVSSTKWFSLFFVPLIPYSTKQFLLCPVCTRGTELTSVQVSSVSAMKLVTTHWRGQLMADDAYAGQVGTFWATLFAPQPRAAIQSSPYQPVPPNPAPPLLPGT